jgi:hypothetical protein
VCSAQDGGATEARKRCALVLELGEPHSRWQAGNSTEPTSGSANKIVLSPERREIEIHVLLPHCCATLPGLTCSSASPVRPRFRLLKPITQNSTPTATMTPKVPRVTDSKNSRDRSQLRWIEVTVRLESSLPPDGHGRQAAAHTGMGYGPHTWTLVAPIDPNPGEQPWFDSLGTGLPARSWSGSARSGWRNSWPGSWISSAIWFARAAACVAVQPCRLKLCHPAVPCCGPAPPRPARDASRQALILASSISLAASRHALVFAASTSM